MESLSEAQHHDAETTQRTLMAINERLRMQHTLKSQSNNFGRSIDLYDGATLSSQEQESMQKLLNFVQKDRSYQSRSQNPYHIVQSGKNDSMRRPKKGTKKSYSIQYSNVDRDMRMMNSDHLDVSPRLLDPDMGYNMGYSNQINGGKRYIAAHPDPGDQWLGNSSEDERIHDNYSNYPSDYGLMTASSRGYSRDKKLKKRSYHSHKGTLSGRTEGSIGAEFSPLSNYTDTQGSSWKRGSFTNGTDNSYSSPLLFQKLKDLEALNQMTSEFVKSTIHGRSKSHISPYSENKEVTPAGWSRYRNYETDRGTEHFDVPDGEETRPSFRRSQQSPFKTAKDMPSHVKRTKSPIHDIYYKSNLDDDRSESPESFHETGTFNFAELAENKFDMNLSRDFLHPQQESSRQYRLGKVSSSSKSQSDLHFISSQRENNQHAFTDRAINHDGGQMFSKRLSNKRTLTPNPQTYSRQRPETIKKSQKTTKQRSISPISAIETLQFSTHKPVGSDFSKFKSRVHSSKSVAKDRVMDGSSRDVSPMRSDSASRSSRFGSSASTSASMSGGVVNGRVSGSRGAGKSIGGNVDKFRSSPKRNRRRSGSKGSKRKDRRKKSVPRDEYDAHNESCELDFEEEEEETPSKPNLPGQLFSSRQNNLSMIEHGTSSSNTDRTGDSSISAYSYRIDRSTFHELLSSQQKMDFPKDFRHLKSEYMPLHTRIDRNSGSSLIESTRRDGSPLPTSKQDRSPSPILSHMGRSQQLNPKRPDNGLLHSDNSTPSPVLVHNDRTTKFNTNTILTLADEVSLRKQISRREYQYCGKLTGHRNSVECIEYNSGFNQLWSGSRDKTIKVWDLSVAEETWFKSEVFESSQSLKTLSGHKKEILSLQYLPQINSMCSGSQDSTIKIWNCESYEMMRTLKGHNGAVYDLIFRDPLNLISASGDESIRVWDLSTGGTTGVLLGHKQAIKSIDILDTSTLLSSSTDGTVKIWDLRTDECIYTIAAGNAKNAAAMTCIGDHIFTAPEEDRVNVWNLKTLTMIKDLKTDSQVYKFKRLSKNKIMFGKENLEIRDLRSLDCIQICQGHQGSIRSISDDVERCLIFTSSFDRSIMMWGQD
eukprot:CAMPEP_0115032438 /NCGR_PEP_ID=MMETSP0216-20121206/39164_1 /TAXON_ID=223996 /ORGANISM="Protocruzia adherens, Strain Boccale" /LENGTH=1100 /DNA_ID=CAMNT_0002410349 /DNA_START=399 /DNA_END=3701 /DNA_ORIENTATION=-